MLTTKNEKRNVQYILNQQCGNGQLMHLHEENYLNLFNFTTIEVKVERPL